MSTEQLEAGLERGKTLGIDAVVAELEATTAEILDNPTK